MKNLIVKLNYVPTRTITNAIKIKCRNGSTEYRNILKGVTEYEIPASVEAVSASVESETRLKEVETPDE